MKNEESYELLLSRAFRFLTLRLRSQKEVEQFLQKHAIKRKIEASVISRVVERLIELGYVDDRKFAQWWIFARRNTKVKGKRMIEQELRAKGVDREIISEAMEREDNVGGEKEIDRARRAMGKRGELWGKLARLDCQRKLGGFLYRRGFSAEIVFKLVDEYCIKPYNKAT